MNTNFASHFVRRTREGGIEFTTLADGRPDWLQEAVREAHQGTLPNDWIYAECRAAVEAFDDESLAGADDDVHEYTDGRVDINTRDLFQWAADFCLTVTWTVAEQEARDMGLPEETHQRIVCIQYAAIRHIADTMKLACAKAAESA